MDQDAGLGGGNGGTGGGTGGGGSNPPPPPPPPPPTETVALPDAALEEEGDPKCDDKVVPLSELIRVRKRAQEAETHAIELSARVDELEKVLAEARASVDAIERRQQIDLALLEADAMDLESARLLTELALGQMDDADVHTAVSELRQRKPFMFKTKRSRSLSAMSGSPRQAADSLADVAQEAARTGDRRALLRYLQIRRGA